MKIEVEDILIDVNILIDALKNLPNFDKWKYKTWTFTKVHMDSKKDRTLIFKKNKETKRWDLVT